MPNRTKTETKREMMQELAWLQDDLEFHWLDRSLPDDWDAMDTIDPVVPHKTRITLRVDTDMLRWFRKLGPGYQKRMNRVLRVYWLSLLCGYVKAYEGDNTIARLEAVSYLRWKRNEELRNGARKGVRTGPASSWTNLRSASPILLPVCLLTAQAHGVA